MVELAPILKKAYWVLALCGLIYVSLIFSLTYPTVQRGVLYSHGINPSRFYDINDVENFGFLKSQVQPFNLLLRIMPPICMGYPAPSSLQEHEEEFSQPQLQVHGNAANLGSGYRPGIYRNFVSMSTPYHPVHVIAFDYRGFGLSTGEPTEEGLITDALTVINYLTSPPLSISPSRIAVVGESLGTGVAAGLAERLAFGDASPVKTLAGFVLVAPFSNIPKLLESYCIMGIFPPLLSPLMGYPRYKKYVLDHIIDRWDTASRLARLTGVSPQSDSDAEHDDKNFHLTIMHAANDPDIPWREGKRAWEAAVGGEDAAKVGTFTEQSISSDNTTEVKTWERRVGSGLKRVRWQKVRYGGHNEIASLCPAALAVMKVFD
ncbi:Abhd12 protein [Coccidioides immitis H538.4]|uniref:Abhd12 protein n=1 Tax=Coccidioides immitis H538.4 TaxID=396776 RepID=A0A0J8RPJ4_COCIT|nr:Abhd12 protein [Coccidioides immitis H538.4]